MKKWGSLLLAAFMISTFIFPAFATDAQVKVEDDFKAMWVATVLNLDYPTKATEDETKLKQEALDAISYAKQMGLNAIILQVRPSGDAIYKCDYFPWSKYLTGTQGKAPSNGFDPLTFWIDEAHKNGIELHAWVNPYRITRKNAKDKAHDFSSLVSTHPAVQYPHWVVKHTDGNLYFNPGIPAVRQYILKSIEEILSNYAVDGIHYDDYFYPNAKFDDAEAYAQHNPDQLSLENWRRENVNILIRETQALVKQYSSKIKFGVSPFAVWRNKSSHKEGSDTKALESYSDHYADTKKWVEMKWVDYIAPQIYWEIGFRLADYKTVLEWWESVVAGTGVKLYVGQAPYRLTEKDASSPWYGTDEIFKQLSLNAQKKVQGSIFFRYQLMKSNANFSKRLAEHYKGKGTLVLENTSLNDLFVARPSSNKFDTTASSYYIGGASNPQKSLFINGVEIINRTKQGYFGYFYKLKDGKNTISIQNGDQLVVKTINKVKSRTASNSGSNSNSSASTSAPATPQKNTLVTVEKGALLAVVNKTGANVYNEPSTANGGVTFLEEGMKDAVVAYNRNFYKLSNGYWVGKNDVKVMENVTFNPQLLNLTHEVSQTHETIRVYTEDHPFMKLTEKGNTLNLAFSGVTSVPVFSKNGDSFIESVSNDSSGYTLQFNDLKTLQGYSYELKSFGYEIKLYKQFQVKDSSLPLKGATIMLDPGHGGKDTGTLGLLGTKYSEKEVVLSISLELRKKLEALGATVVMTRETDKDVSLQERVQMSKKVAPHLFVSIHADNAADTIDLSKVKGFSVFFKNKNSQSIASKIQSFTINDLFRNDRKVKNMNFYVVRGTWSPSVLIETGFMSNPEDFEWMTQKTEHEKIAQSWANAIENYFKK